MTNDLRKLLADPEKQKAIREALVGAGVACAKEEIRADVARGVVPGGVRSFAELHDHVDANEYGGGVFLACLLAPGDLVAEPLLVEIMNEIQDAVDKWIREGGHVAEP